MKLIKLLPLLLSIFLFVYIFGIDHTISFITSFFFLYLKYQNVLYFIMLLFILFYLLNNVLSLYILHLYCRRREIGEKIYISKTLPDFLIKYLKELKYFSKKDILVKEIKRMTYIQIVISSIAAIIWIFWIFFI